MIITREIRPFAALAGATQVVTQYIECFGAKMVSFAFSAYGTEADVLATGVPPTTGTYVEVSNDPPSAAWVRAGTGAATDLTTSGALIGSVLSSGAPAVNNPTGGAHVLVFPVSAPYIMWKAMRIKLWTATAGATISGLHGWGRALYDDVGAQLSQFAKYGVGQVWAGKFVFAGSDNELTPYDQDADRVMLAVPVGARVTGTGIAADTVVTLASGTLIVSPNTSAPSAATGNLLTFAW